MRWARRQEMKRPAQAGQERVWELEALATEQLREIVKASIRGVLELEAFEGEVGRERREQPELDAKRRRLRQALLDDLDELN